MSISVKVKFSGGTHTIPCEPSWTVLQLKEEIAKRLEDVTPDRLRLICLGAVLGDNTATLAAQRIVDGSSVHMVVKPADRAAPPPTQAEGAPRADETQQPQNTTPQGGQTPPPGPGADAFANIFNVFRQQGGTAQPQPQQQQQQAGADAETGGMFGGIDMQGLMANLMGNVGPALQAGLQRARGEQQQQQQQPQQPREEPREEPAPQTNINPAEAAARTAARPMPVHNGNAMFHVHIHVTLDNLHEVPAKINAIRDQLPQGTAFHVNAERGGQPQPGQANATPSPDARPADFTDAVREEFNAAQTGRGTGKTMADIAREHGFADELAKDDDDNDDEGDEASILEALTKQMLEQFEMADMLRLMQGDWTSVERLRPSLKEHLTKAMKGDFSNENRANFSRKAAFAIVRHAVNTAEIYDPVAERQREGRSAFHTTMWLMEKQSRQLVDLVLDGPPEGQLFSTNVRSLLVESVGHSTDFHSNEVFVGGVQDTEFITQVLLRKALDTAGKSHPQLAPMLPMASGMCMGLLRQWQIEWKNRFEDKAKEVHAELVRVASRPFSKSNYPPKAVKAQPASAATAAKVAEPSEDDDDALFDEAFEEVEHVGTSAATASAAVDLTSVKAALEDPAANVPLEKQADILKNLAQASAKLGKPSSAVYHELTGKKKAEA